MENPKKLCVISHLDLSVPANSRVCDSLYVDFGRATWRRTFRCNWRPLHRSTDSTDLPMAQANGAVVTALGVSSTNSLRVAIFDFDQTLASGEISMWIDRASMPIRGFGGTDRLEVLSQMLLALQSMGLVMAICSMNSRDVIRNALDIVGLLPFFELGVEVRTLLSRADPTHAQLQWLIRDRADCMQHGSRKSAVITRTILTPLGVTDADAIFVDDDLAHIKDVNLRLPRAATVHVPRSPKPALQADTTGRLIREMPTGGMQRAECEAVLAWARGEPPLPHPSSPPTVPPPPPSAILY